MTFRHFLGASALFVSVSTAITGCAKQQQQPKGAAEEQPQQVERVSQLAQTDPSQTPAEDPKHTDLKVSSDKTEDILAAKTQSYAEEVERLLAARADRTGQAHDQADGRGIEGRLRRSEAALACITRRSGQDRYSASHCNSRSEAAHRHPAPRHRPRDGQPGDAHSRPRRVRARRRGDARRQCEAAAGRGAAAGPAA